MATVWVPCNGCSGAGGWYVVAENGRQVWMLCQACDGARGTYVSV